MKKILSLVLALLLFFSMSVPCLAKNEVKISKTKAVLEVDATLKLKMFGTTSNATWKSSRPSVASVSKSGTVTAKTFGFTTITATVNKKKYECKITVADSSGPEYLEETLYVGDRFEGLIGGYEYSSDKSILNIDVDDYVALKPGMVYVGDYAGGYMHDYIFHIKNRLTAEVYTKTLRQEDYINITLFNSDEVDVTLRFEELDVDNDIITCYWGEGNGDDVPLWFTLNDYGETSVIVTAYYGDGITESITINITVE